MNTFIVLMRCFAVSIVALSVSCSYVQAQSSTLQLRNGAHTTTLVSSASTNVIIQIPSLSDGTHYIATSTANPGTGGLSITSQTNYGTTSPQNVLGINGSQYVFDIAYANTLVNSNSLGARVNSTATDGNNDAVGLTLSATSMGAGATVGLQLSAGSLSGSQDAIYIDSGRLSLLESAGSIYTVTFTAGNQASDVSYVLPVIDGSGGQFLSTSGNGVLSWTTPTVGIDAFNNAKSEGVDFSGSLLVGRQSTGALSNANYNTGISTTSFSKLTTGQNNTAVGRGALDSLTSANGSVGVGSGASQRTTTANFNTAVGYWSSRTTTSWGTTHCGSATGQGNNSPGYTGSIGFGYGSLQSSNGGSWLIAIGSESILNRVNGIRSVAIGQRVFNRSPDLTSTTTSHNIGIGGLNGRYLRSGEDNIFLGYGAGNGISGTAASYSCNVLLGTSTGDDLTTGRGNIMIGFMVGSAASLDVESNLLLIDNSNVNPPLIQGDFTNSSEYLKINGDLQVTGGTTLAAGADQAVAGNAVTVDATAYSAVKVTSDNDATADAITITGGSNGMVMYIDFVNTGNNDVTIGGVTHAISDTKSAGITVCRINDTWRVVGIAEY
jgi:hypothetical protein